jgi:pimeloyl-ACP methyl ester carboxylesterase
MPHVSVGDIQMYYEVHGSGEPLVMIAGLGGDHSGFKELQLPAFEDRYRCVLLDNRGVGQTDKPETPYTTAQLAADVVGLLDVLEIEAAHIAGWSMGGAIAQHVAAKHPNRVLTASLHCTWPRTDNFLRWQLERRAIVLREIGREELNRNVLLSTFTPGYFERNFEKVLEMLDGMANSPHPQPDYAYLNQLSACVTHDALDELDRIDVPILITVGAEDPLIAPRFSYQLKERIPQAELVVMDSAAHGHSLEDTDRFNAICAEFLSRHSNGSAGNRRNQKGAQTAA